MAVTQIRTEQFNYNADLSAQSHKLTNLQDGSAAQDAATFGQLQAMMNGLDWKGSVRVVADSNINLSSMPSAIDGVTLTSGDRFLAAGQSTPSQNGLYVFNGAGSAATRSADADVSAEVTANLAVAVEEGTTYADTQWKLTTDNPITLGSTSLTFVQFGAGTTYTADDASVTIVGTGIKQTPGTDGQIDQTVNGVVTPVTISGDITIAEGGAATAAANILREADIVTRETPAGTINGSNTVFTLANTPVSGTEHVFLNGILQDPGGSNDYTISGPTITFNVAPVTNDKIRVSYFK